MGRKSDLRRRIADLRNFQDLLGELLAVSEFVVNSLDNDHRLVAKAGHESDWWETKGRIDLHAPQAARAFAESGMHIGWQTPSGAIEPLNPATHWATICSDRPRFSLDALDSCTIQAIGALGGRLHDPIKGERRPTTESLHPAARAAWKFGAWLVGGLALAWITWKLGWS